MMSFFYIKKLLFLALTSFMLIGCFTFGLAEVAYIPDISCKYGGYYESRPVGVGIAMPLDSKVYVKFRTLNGSDKIIVIVERRFKNKVVVESGDKVLLKFSYGEELVLTYNKKVSEYDNGRFRLRAKSKVIEDFGALRIVVMETSDGEYIFEVTEISAERLRARFNLVKAEARLKYGDKE